ncbi:MAG TPA: sugar phosphate isomerase/epimerase family protein [Acidobacteriota bacterium]|nr:sugar phosphate isomerase/epimerase family protein [Acidobacteriota bacterium]
MVSQPPLSVTTVCYPLSVSPEFTVERAFEGISRAGLRLVEIVAIPGYCEHLQLEQMGDKQIEHVKRMLQEYGLTANVINVAADLTTQPGVDFLGEAMRVAYALSISTVVAGIEQANSDEKAADFKRLAPHIASLAEKFGVTVALEIHGGLINNGVEGARLLEELSLERIKLTYDMANVVYYGGVLPQDDLAMMGGDVGRFVAHVHLKDKANMELEDYNFPPFGRGILNFADVLNLLDKGGYEGPMTLEVELDGRPQSPEVVDQALIESCKFLAQFWT